MADDLFTSRVKAFTGLLRSASEFRKPSELELYEQKEKISSGIRIGETKATNLLELEQLKAEKAMERAARPGDLAHRRKELELQETFDIKKEVRTAGNEADVLAAKYVSDLAYVVDVGAATSEQKLLDLEDPRHITAKMAMEANLAELAYAQGAEKTKYTGADNLRESEKYDTRGNMWIGARADLQPGQYAGPLFGFKKFDPANLIKLTGDRVLVARTELSLLEAQEEEYGFHGLKNPRRAALKEEIDSLMHTLVNNDWVKNKMAKKGNSSEKTFYNSYIKSILEVNTYLEDTKDLVGKRVSTKTSYQQ